MLELSSPVERLQQQIREAEETLRETHDQLLRAAADYENTRRSHRLACQKKEQESARAVFLALLPVCLEFERLIAEAAPYNPHADGLRMIGKQFQAALKRFSGE